MSGPYPGDTTAGDWSDHDYWFWRVIDHDKPPGVARTEKDRSTGSGRARSTDRVRYGFCTEHKSFDCLRSERITGREALTLLAARRSEIGGEK